MKIKFYTNLFTRPVVIHERHFLKVLENFEALSMKILNKIQPNAFLSYYGPYLIISLITFDSVESRVKSFLI